MIRNFLKILGVILISLTALGLGFLISQPQDRLLSTRNSETGRQRIIIPRGTGDSEYDSQAERMAYEDSISTRIALREGEVVLSVLNQDFDGDPAEEQIIAYRDYQEQEGPVHIAYVDYDEVLRLYRRVWEAPTAVTMPFTFSMSTQDLIGDRSVSLVVTGMEDQGTQTLMVFHRPFGSLPAGPEPREAEGGELFRNIADIRIEGSVRIREAERPQSYHLGISHGASFSIAAYGHDAESQNILDQVEIIYSYNAETGRYEQSKITKVPGSQIEQRRLRELLSGAPGVFEEFIYDLWYFVGSQGTLDTKQYIYFDPPNGEIIFFDDGAQQVFRWQNSSPTRYGLYVTSQNISVTTLRRTIDIELESLDSVRVKVFEDVRLKIRADNTWDGSYRRAPSTRTSLSESPDRSLPYIDARYESSMGNMHFSPDGSYEIVSSTSIRRGRYAFFRIEGREAVELRSTEVRSTETQSGESPSVSAAQVPATAGDWYGNQTSVRETYLVEHSGTSLILSRVQIGTMGIRELQEGTITLTPEP
ncbi:MAG: pallilysin-related adhesin [Treponema sp.]|jgi:hypothetical protein|nr:pallilysin-related adhesin [Treponema sp.]